MMSAQPSPDQKYFDGILLAGTHYLAPFPTPKPSYLRSHTSDTTHILIQDNSNYDLCLVSRTKTKRKEGSGDHVNNESY